MDKFRFLVTAIILLIIWSGFMIFLYLKADEITKDPCSICSKRMGKDIYCYTQEPNPVSRIYYTNYTIKNVRS